MASPEKIKKFQSSYSRCTLDPEFIQTFYKLFMTSSDQVPQYFEHIPVERQIKMLEYALYLQMLAIDDSPEARKCMVDLGDSHNKLTVKPHLYDCWLNSLVMAVENYDGKLHPGIGEVWREVLSPGLDLMKQRHTKGVNLKVVS